MLAGVHLIAEPWDAGHDGYQVGRFPGRFLEWNDKFRDAVRGYWLGRDAGAHVGLICDGAGPTFLLKHWARDRTRGPKLPLEQLPV